MNALLWRMDCFELEYGPYPTLIALTFNHLIYDLHSLNYLLTEISDTYNQLAIDTTYTPNPLPLHYYDFARWQHAYLQSDHFATQLQQWQNRLKNYPIKPLSLTRMLKHYQTDQTIALQKEGPGRLQGHIELTLSDKILNYSQKHHIPTSYLLISAYGLLLSLLSEESDVCFIVPYLYRKHQDTEQLLGCFAMHYLVHIACQPNCSLTQLIELTSAQMLELTAIQDVPTIFLLDILQKHDMNPNDIAGLQILYHGEISHQTQPFNETRSQLIEQESPPINAQLIIHLIKQLEPLKLIIEYCPTAFDQTQITQIAELFIAILYALTDPNNARQTICQLKTMLSKGTS